MFKWFKKNELSIKDRPVDLAGACYCIAAADGELHDAEARQIAEQVRELLGGDAPTEEIERLLQSAHEELSRLGLDAYVRGLGRGLSEQARSQLLGAAAAIAAADGKLAKEERHVYFKLASALDVPRDRADVLLTAVTASHPAMQRPGHAGAAVDADAARDGEARQAPGRAGDEGPAAAGGEGDGPARAGGGGAGGRAAGAPAPVAGVAGAGAVGDGVRAGGGGPAAPTAETKQIADALGAAGWTDPLAALVEVGIEVESFGAAAFQFSNDRGALLRLEHHPEDRSLHFHVTDQDDVGTAFVIAYESKLADVLGAIVAMQNDVTPGDLEPHVRALAAASPNVRAVRDGEPAPLGP